MRLSNKILVAAIKSLSEEDRREVLGKLLPGFDEDFRSVWLSSQAALDLQLSGLPQDIEHFQIAVDNCRHFLELAWMEGQQHTLGDRIASLIEVSRRSSS